jgi:UDP-glucose/GDP-mannose dehydrogenase family, NAD binding domain
MADVVAGEAAQFIQKVENRSAHIGIIGMGYVGLPLSLLFSEERFAVTGFDIDGRKVSTLNSGGSYIVRIPGTEIQSAQKHGFRATADYSEISSVDVIIICVPTPLNEYHEPDLSYIRDTASSLKALPILAQPKKCSSLSSNKETAGRFASTGTHRRTVFTWPFRPSGKTPATTPLPDATFLKWLAA